jgi:hypothetical protein
VCTRHGVKWRPRSSSPSTRSNRRCRDGSGGAYLEGPTNDRAFEFMDPAWAAKLPTHPDHNKVQFVRDTVWWGENRPEVIRRWQQFVL